MILARCPACQTVFRVRPEQLRAHQGAVRCGHCYTPFDALANLVDEAPPAPTPSATPAAISAATSAAVPPDAPRPVPAGTPPAPPDEAPLHTAEPIKPRPDEETFFDLEGAATEASPIESDRLESVDLSPALSTDGDDALFTGTSADLTFELPDRFSPTDYSELPPLKPASPFEVAPDALSSAGAPSTASRPAFAVPPEAPPEPVPPEPPTARAEDHFVPPGSVRSDEDFIAPPVAPAPEPETAHSEAPSDDIDAPGDRLGRDASPELPPLWASPGGNSNAPQEFVQEAASDSAFDRAVPSSNARRTSLSLAVGLLLGMLLVQAIFLFRAEIARDWPGMRPLLVAACEHVGCTVDMPRAAGQISIETSDLQSEPSDPARFVLSATVRNRAPFVQEFPHLELTLTDSRDRPLVRRVFTPVEWTGRADVAAGFVSGEEIAVRLAFSAPGVDAAGYRLYVFYP